MYHITLKAIVLVDLGILKVMNISLLDWYNYHKMGSTC